MKALISLTIAGVIVFVGGRQLSNSTQGGSDRPTVATARGARHVMVFGGEDVAAGWPANHGVWSWDDGEILVGFTYGTPTLREGHNIVEGGPIYSVLARSVDGGETWAMENPGNFSGDDKPAPIGDPPGGIDFAHPDFVLTVKSHILRAMRGEGESFYYSYDRGRNWKGAYHFGDLMSEPGLAGQEFTARTDYLAEGRDGCVFFMSARRPSSRGTIRKDKVFVARTSDGGKSFDFVSWVVGLEDPHRAVMPSTVRCSPTKLVMAVRRRAVPENTNWIDVYASNDTGGSWSFSSRVNDTGVMNGNPPALVRLRDGRLCCVYGSRSQRSMLAQFSKDDGATWGPEIVLRDEYEVDSFGNQDLGYPRLVQRADGRLVAIYYWSTEEQPNLHIAATIWDPEGVE
jgi:hypothetical protein